MNKLEREGYTFEIIEPPFNHETWTTLRAVSDEWLDGREEKGFSLGFFDTYYLEQAPIAIAKTEKVLSLDLLR